MIGFEAPPAWSADAACASSGLPLDEWFPTRETGQANHGQAAKAVCAGCPAIRPCLEEALDRKEEYGIWGGAGEAGRRWLARAYKAGGARWQNAFVRHLDGLDGGREIADRNGQSATHGLRATYNRGCRCRACRLAASIDVAEQAQRRAVAA